MLINNDLCGLREANKSTQKQMLMHTKLTVGTGTVSVSVGPPLVSTTREASAIQAPVSKAIDP